MSTSLLKRLDLLSSASKFDDMLQGVEDVANLPDLAGQITYASRLDDGLDLHRITCAYFFRIHKYMKAQTWPPGAIRSHWRAPRNL